MFHVKSVSRENFMKGNEKIGNKLGRLGEDIACLFIEKKGYQILGRNFRKNSGEIDIIAKKSGILTFFEVKSVSREIKKDGTVIEKTGGYRAEENVHKNKVSRLKRVIQIYLSKNMISPETNWLFGLIVVKLDQESKKAVISFNENVIL